MESNEPGSNQPRPGQTTRVRAGQAQPTYAVPVASNRSAWLIMGAVLAGLGVGGFLFYRVHSTHEAPVPALTTESAPTPVTPAPEASGARSGSKGNHRSKRVNGFAKTPRVGELAQGTSASAAARARRDGITPPVLLSPSPSVQSPSSNPAARQTTNRGAPAGPQVTASAESAGRRRAMQDPGTQYSPMPVPGPPAAAEPTSASPTASQSRASQPGSAAGRPVLIRHPEIREEASAKPAYNGPGAGLATWTGKLGKDETLTITGSTASRGVLSGAGLPGVPIEVTVDQSNLGFAEMPNASNGYRRLVIRSHSKHDKITIHWTVIEQQ